MAEIVFIGKARVRSAAFGSTINEHIAFPRNIFRIAPALHHVGDATRVACKAREASRSTVRRGCESKFLPTPHSSARANAIGYAR